MKKILALLGSVGLIASSSLTVVACNNKGSEKPGDNGDGNNGDNNNGNENEGDKTPEIPDLSKKIKSFNNIDIVVGKDSYHELINLNNRYQLVTTDYDGLFSFDYDLDLHLYKITPAAVGQALFFEIHEDEEDDYYYTVLGINFLPKTSSGAFRNINTIIDNPVLPDIDKAKFPDFDNPVKNYPAVTKYVKEELMPKLFSGLDLNEVSLDFGVSLSEENTIQNWEVTIIPKPSSQKYEGRPLTLTFTIQ